MAILNQMSCLKFRAVAFAIFFALSFANASFAQDQAHLQLQEHKIKSALIYNLLKYSNWNDGASVQDKDLRVCLLGGDSFDGYLNPLEGRTAQQRTIHIVEINAAQQALACHLVFIHRNQTSNITAIISQLEGKAILSVSDIENFAALGGIVELSTRSDQRVHLQINEGMARKSNLVIGDRILKLAEIVGPS